MFRVHGTNIPTFVAKVREYNDTYSLPSAIRMAMDYCIEHDILKDFFTKERKAIYMYSLFEYNQKGHMKVIREEGREEGLEEAAINTIIFGYEDGLSNEAIRDRLKKAYKYSDEKIDKLFAIADSKIKKM
ncbi:hypothetical protein [Butyrivibrio sp. AE2015]|uniref:hypothetical protein n=1 Tax=Butyrivibrio sp. AE2015 TaxID=1280663 RepID=UPI0003B4E295|nr:hypothetical protein [Butyrivibrio sp. AE2015]